MVDSDEAKEKFGCGRCWPASADVAWEAGRLLSREVELIDESHFHVMIRSCGVCSQRFVSVFTETIDWADGEDPQYWTILPITVPEATELMQRSGSFTENDLNSLPANRQSLRRDFPKGEAPRTFWAFGILVGPHD